MAVKCLVYLDGGRGWRCGSTTSRKTGRQEQSEASSGTRSCDYHWVILHLFVVWTSAMGANCWGYPIDLGVQTTQVSNQTRIYSLPPEVHSRLNALYIMFYFAGGALGSFSRCLWLESMAMEWGLGLDY